MDTAVFTLLSLSTGYHARHDSRREVSRGLSGELHGGRLTCLIGGNGVGKSTLLRTMAGLQKPLGGKVLLNGRDLSGYGREQLARAVSVVLTEPVPTDELTCSQLVAMGRLPHSGYWGRLGDDDRRICREALTMVAMEGYADRRLSSLSDGERQRILIAKALAQSVSAMLLDEPLSYLDYPGKVGTLRLLHRLAHQEGLAVLLSTHDLELALQLADELWLMHTDGSLLTGSADDMMRSDALAGLLAEAGAWLDIGRKAICLDGTTQPIQTTTQPTNR